MKFEWCFTMSFSRGPKPKYWTMHPADTSLASYESCQAVTAFKQTRLIFSFAFSFIHRFNLHVSNCSASQRTKDLLWAKDQDSLLWQQKQGRASAMGQRGESAAGLSSARRVWSLHHSQSWQWAWTSPPPSCKARQGEAPTQLQTLALLHCCALLCSGGAPHSRPPHWECRQGVRTGCSPVLMFFLKTNKTTKLNLLKQEQIKFYFP